MVPDELHTIGTRRVRHLGGCNPKLLMWVLRPPTVRLMTVILWKHVELFVIVGARRMDP